MFSIRDANPSPLAITRRPRTTPIEQIQWHATRGVASHYRQVEATENWFANPANDLGGWGGSADFVVGPDWRIGGAIAIVQFGDWINTFSSWSAGAGGTGTLYAAECGVAIEVAQSAALEAFSPETIEACAWLVGVINETLRGAGQPEIPPVHIPRWDQLPAEPIPRGHIGHDELANGRKLWKTDPGPLFPWGELLSRLQPVDRFQQGRREMYDGIRRDAPGVPVGEFTAWLDSLPGAWGIP